MCGVSLSMGRRNWEVGWGVEGWGWGWVRGGGGGLGVGGVCRLWGWRMN